MAHSLLLDKFRRRVPEEIAIAERREIATARQGSNDSLGRRFIEEGDGIARPAPADDAVARGADGAAGPCLKQLAEIHDEGVIAGRRIDPVLADLNLQAGHAILRQKRDEPAAQGNARDVGREFVDDQILSADRSGKEKIDLIRRKVKRRPRRYHDGEEREPKHTER